MKKLLFILSLIVGLKAGAQVLPPLGCPTCSLEINGIHQDDSLYLMPYRQDTLIHPSRAGGLVYAYGNAWLWTGTPLHWTLVTGISFGTIPGNVAAQTNLYDTILARQMQMVPGYGWKIAGGNQGVFDSSVVRKVDSMYVTNDSTIAFLINGHTYTLKVKGSASGTVVSSIALNASPIFTGPANFTNSSGNWSLVLGLQNQSANSFLAGPSLGSPGAPTFRSLAVGDLPTGIPNSNLQNSTMGLLVDNAGTLPAFAATSVALGNTILLHLPLASATATGTLRATDWVIFSNKVDSATMSNDSVYEWRSGIKSFRYFIVGGGGGGLSNLNGLTASVQNFATGTAGTSPNISSSTATHTFNIPILNGADTGVVTPGQKAIWDGKISDSGFAVVNSALAGPPIAKAVVGSARFIQWDTAAGNPGAITTKASRQKLSDSLQNLINTHIADSGLSSRNAVLAGPPISVTAGIPRFINWDTAAGNPGAITTKASRQKLSDSLQGIIASATSLTFNRGLHPVGSQRGVLGDKAVGATEDSSVYFDLGNPTAANTWTWDSVGSGLKIKALAGGSGTPQILVHMNDSSLAQVALGTNLSITSGVLNAAGGGGGTPGNPTAVVGLVAVNGSSTNYMRADAAPPIDQTIAPTWSGLHTFTGGATFTSSAPNLINYGGTFTTTANNQYMEGSNPTITLRGTASDVFSSRSYTPTFTIGANNQTVNVLSIVPTTNVGSFTGTTTNALFLGGGIGLNTDNAFNIGDGSHALQKLYSHQWISPTGASIGVGAGQTFNVAVGGSNELLFASTKQMTIGGYTGTGAYTGGTPTALFATDASGVGWPIALGTGLSFSGQTLNSTGGGGTTMTNVTFSTPLIQEYDYGTGLASSNNVTGYTAASIDNVPFPFVSNGNGVGTEQGGWVVLSTSGDSVLVSWPIGVAIGASIIAGHPTRIGRLEAGAALRTYPDSAGQITYYLDSLTGFHWYNQGIGGQVISQVRRRFYRDALGIISNPNDGLGAQTLSHSPRIIILGMDAALNSVYAGVPDSAIEQDVMWMCATANYYNIPMVVTTVIGDGSGETVAQMQEIMRLNDWLMKGNLNQFGVTVVDVMGRWASGFYNNLMANGGLYNNPVNSPQYFSSLVSGANVHFTVAGYDSVALDIFNKAKLPVIDSVVLTSGIAGTNPIANLNRPTSVRFSNTTSYVAANNPFNAASIMAFGSGAVNATSTGNVATPGHYIFGDSVWIEIQSSTNVTGTSTQTGISSVMTHLNNNPTNANWYKAPLPFSGSQNAILNGSSLKLTARDYPSSIPVMDVYLADMTNHALQLNVSGGATTMVLNGLSNTALLNSATLSIYNSGGNAIGTNGSIIATGTGGQMGSVQLGFTASPGNTGYGVGIINSGLQLYAGSNNTLANNLFQLNDWSTSTPIVTSSNLNIAHLNIPLGVSNINGYSDTINDITISETINDTVTNKIPAVIGGILLKQTQTSIANDFIKGFRNDNGYNAFNVFGGASVVGSILPEGSAMLDVNSTTKAFAPPRMTTTQRNAIGYVTIASVTGGSGYGTTYPKVTISGGSGTGARAFVDISGGALISGGQTKMIDAGSGYGGGSVPTATLSNGTGTGGAVTLAIHGPDDGAEIYNTTVDSMQYYSATCSCWIDEGAVTTSSSPVIFSQTANGTALTSTSSTNLFGTGTGSLTIAAGTLQAGQTITIHGFFIVSTTTGSNNCSLTPEVGGTGVGTWVPAYNASLSSVPAEYTAFITILTTGSSGTMTVSQSLNINGQSGQAQAFTASTTATINTTISNAITLLGQWNNTGNSIQSVPSFTVKVQ